MGRLHGFPYFAPHRFLTRKTWRQIDVRSTSDAYVRVIFEVVFVNVTVQINGPGPVKVRNGGF